MLYMIRPGVAERIEAFVRGGGTFVTTYLSGIVNETDLSFLGGWPGPLRKIVGVWAEEIEVLNDEETVSVAAAPGNDLGLSGSYSGRIFADLIHTEGADVLASYASGWYAGRPALTANRFGNGAAYYLTSRIEDRFLREFYRSLVERGAIARAIDAELPAGVSASLRTDGERRFVFLLNFNSHPKMLRLTGEFEDVLAGKRVIGEIELPTFGLSVLSPVPR
jgi:beta-galactosidase